MLFFLVCFLFLDHIVLSSMLILLFIDYWFFLVPLIDFRLPWINLVERTFVNFICSDSVNIIHLWPLLTMLILLILLIFFWMAPTTIIDPSKCRSLWFVIDCGILLLVTKQSQQKLRKSLRMSLISVLRYGKLAIIKFYHG